MYILKKVKKPVVKDDSSSTTTNGTSTSTMNSKQRRNNNAQVRVCGCMATTHKFIGSCMSCGRIKCEEEKHILNCPFCDTYIVKPMTAEGAVEHGFDEDTVKAYQHKVM
jgi:hypothetical protein